MRWLRNAFLAACAAALILLLGSMLVRGPETGAPAAEAAVPILRQHAVLCADTKPTDLRSASAAAEAERGMLPARERPDPPNRTVRCDRNGRPLQAEVWHRAVWNACPPEGRFG